MADITLAEFRQRFPEFTYTAAAGDEPASGVSDSVISPLIAQAYEISDTSAEASVYCLAHLVSLEVERLTDASNGAPDGGAGVVKAETIGPRRIDYMTQASKGREAFFEPTFYGRRVLTLESRTPEAVIGVVVA